MIFEVAPNIFRIPVPLPENPLKNLNAYLIRGERNLLIDTGFRREECRQALLEGLKEAKVSMDNTDIFLTHLHSDHSGLAPELAGKGTTVFLSAYDRTRLPGKYCELDWKQSDGFYASHGFPRPLLAQIALENPARACMPLAFDDYSLAQEDDLYCYGGYTLRAIATPGHTPGHLCLYEQEQKILFLGDHVLFDITPNICAWQGYRNALGAYRQSLQKISTLAVALPLPGHRTVQTDLKSRIRTLLSHHEARCAEILRLLSEEPEQTAYSLTGRMHWQIRCRNWDDFPAAQKWFAVGECIAHLDDLTERGLTEQTRTGSLKRYACTPEGLAVCDSYREAIGD